MSDDNPETEEEEEQPQPDLDEDDYATVDPDLAQQAAEAATDSDDEDQDGDEQDEVDNSVPSTPAESRKSVGDVYVRAMGAAAYAARDRAGEGVENDRSAVIDEYADLATDLELNEYMNQWYQENIGHEDMSPGQGLVAMSGMFFAMVMLEDPSIVDGALDGVSGE
jgi:hypothetical protein